MPPVGFEPTISAGERPQNYALDRAATGTGILSKYHIKCRHIYKYREVAQHKKIALLLLALKALESNLSSGTEFSGYSSTVICSVPSSGCLTNNSRKVACPN